MLNMHGLSDKRSGMVLADLDPGAAAMQVVVGIVPRGPLLSIAEDEEIGGLVGQMAGRGASCVLVERAGRPAGIITRQRAIDRGGIGSWREAWEIMEPLPASISPIEPIGLALHRMRDQRSSHLALTARNHEVVGIVSATEICTWLSAALPRQRHVIGLA